MAAPATAIRATNSSSRATTSRNDVPPSSSSVRPNASQNARLAPYGTTIASWSTTTMKLGIVSATAFAKSRWRWRSSSRRFRSVMSIPPAMIRTTLPLSSTSGAECQAITRSFPFASVNTFSYSDASKAGAAAWKRSIIASRSSGSMNTSQKYAPSSRLRSSSPLATSTARLKFRMRPSGSTTDSRLGAVLMIVSRKRY